MVRMMEFGNFLTPELWLQCSYSFYYCNSTTVDAINVDPADWEEQKYGAQTLLDRTGSLRPVVPTPPFQSENPLFFGLKTKM